MSQNQRMPVWLFGAAVILSAFLLFQVQPLISKAILPWFGGGSAVWSAAMLFFQTVLLGGYAYAHLITRLSTRTQAVTHLGVLAALLVYMVVMALLRRAPILPGEALQPEPGGFPSIQVLGALALSVGLPYLLLSTTSSLAQSWYTRITDSSQPYIFYALSNAASLLGLVTYPLVFEPLWTVSQQAILWSVGFVIFLALSAGTALLLLRRSPDKMVRNTRRAARAARANPPAPNAEEDAPAPPPSARRIFYWLALATVSSVMLLAVTNQITQDVPSVPFLWVLPLSVYLFTYIIAFSGQVSFPPLPYAIVTLIGLWLGFAAISSATVLPILQLIFVILVMLFLLCLFCHGMLYASRPHPRYLTTFYLVTSIGGALGGVIVSLIAPLIFTDFWEYPLGLITAGLLALSVLVRATQRGRWLWLIRIPAALSVLALAFFLFQNAWTWIDSSVHMSRSFYGVLRVRRMDYEGAFVYNLVHGRIIHGSQGITEPFSSRPTRYYSPSTGIGLAFQYHQRRAEGIPLRAGMVGLGAGTVAAYGQPGDVIRFYEIDPDVIAIARDPRFFTYLKDTPAQVDIVLGDARLSMERELKEGQPQQYDILAIDAFSGDSIPTHLIDREAVALYLRHLAPDGILAFHISNRHLDLEPVVAALAGEYNLYCYTIVGGSEDWLGSGAMWVMLSRDHNAFETPQLVAARQDTRMRPELKVWTDDYSNLIQVLR